MIAPLTAPINVTATGDTTVISAKAGVPVIVKKLFLVSDAATNLTFKDTNGTSKTGAFALLANGSLTLPYDQLEWFRCDVGYGLVINQSGTANIKGLIVYTRG